MLMLVYLLTYVQYYMLILSLTSSIATKYSENCCVMTVDQSKQVILIEALCSENRSIYMKKVFFALLTISGFFTCVSSCTSDGSCSSGEVSIQDLQDFGCNNTAFSMTVATLNDFELIRTQEDYDRQISAQCTPSIDWTEHDMIAGMIQLNQGLSSIDKVLVMNCAQNTLTLSITVTKSASLDAPNVSFNAIIPKIKDEQNLFVDFNISG